MGRNERTKAQEAFKFQPEVQVLLATDAAGEGINLQRAHLMVNYDLPWNPNRLEQRFGRIHRIGQTEVCHLWNLVAGEPREGDVYRHLLEKLDQARQALGGRVFDVLGKLNFDGRPLRDLLIEAIRFGDNPAVKARVNSVLEGALEREKLQALLENEALAKETLDYSQFLHIREDMERAEARRLQPGYIKAFFIKAFTRLGGIIHQHESRRYEITHVPSVVHTRDRQIGNRAPVLPRYERICFEKELIAPPGQAMAAFVCPGHPLLDTVLDLTLERHRDILKRGTILVDDNDPNISPRIFFYLDLGIQDARTDRNGERRLISKRMLYIELCQAGMVRHIHYAPYLDYRPLTPEEPSIETILSQPECSWIDQSLERTAVAYAIQTIVPEHVDKVKNARLEHSKKTRLAVKERLTKEIIYWNSRAEELKLQEQAGKPNARLNSNEARRRADELQARLQKRLAELEQEARIMPLSPVVQGGFIVIPRGIIERMSTPGLAPSPGTERSSSPQTPHPIDTQTNASRARDIVMDVERHLGYEPVDREFDKLGYDIESRDPVSGRLRLI